MSAVPRRGPVWAREAALCIGLGVAAAAVAAFSGGFLGLERYAALAGLAVGVGGAAFLGYLFGPARVGAGVFLVGMLAMHQHLSFFTFQAIGVEWHPREILLFLFVAHAAVRVAGTRVPFREDVVHFHMAAYAAFYLLIGAVGLVNQYDMGAIIKEIRFPVFLLAYPALVVCVATRDDLRLHAGLLLAGAACIALAGCAFFAYTLASGNVINVQNAWGAFVQRQVGPMLVQSVRPNGHMFFEVSLAVLLSLACCGALRPVRRLGALLLCGLFAAAIAITMMRTAYIAAGLSVGLLVYLALPPTLRVLAAFAGLLAGSVAALIFGFAAYELLQGALPDIEVSLKGRVEEITGAWIEFTRHPIVGTGMGRSFEAFGFVAKTSQFSYAQAEYQSLHNVWMYFLFKGGLAGILLTVAGLGGLALRGMRVADRLEDPVERAFLRGLVAAYAAQLAASLAMPRLTYPEGHVFVAMTAVAILILGAPRAKA